jgi:hypothetical protein
MRHFAFAFAAAALCATSARAEDIWVTMDQVMPHTFKQEVSQIVVGNPGIADVTVRDKTRVLLFGKAPGMTNLFLFDDKGEEIGSVMVRVRALSAELLVVQKGNQRMTYHCMTVCEQTLTVGDSGDAFGTVSNQVAQKYQQAANAAPTAAE